MQNKNQSASELLHDSNFNQALGNLVNSANKTQANQESLLDKVQSLLQSEQEIGLYVLPGLDEYEFDSEIDAIDQDENDGQDESSEDIENFFTDIKMQAVE